MTRACATRAYVSHNSLSVHPIREDPMMHARVLVRKFGSPSAPLRWESESVPQALPPAWCSPSGLLAAGPQFSQCSEQRKPLPRIGYVNHLKPHAAHVASCGYVPGSEAIARTSSNRRPGLHSFVPLVFRSPCRTVAAVMRPAFPVAPWSWKSRFSAAAFHSAHGMPFEHQHISSKIRSRIFHGSGFSWVWPSGCRSISASTFMGTGSPSTRRNSRIPHGDAGPIQVTHGQSV